MRKADVALTCLAVVSAVLTVIGALKLYDTMEPDERTGFWVRVILGVGFAFAAVAALATRHWLVGATTSLLSVVTPLAEGWAWVAIGSIACAVWALARAWNELTYERKPSQISE